jgi:hypothetical protein
MTIKPPYQLRDIDGVPVIIAPSTLPDTPPSLVAHPIDAATGRDIVVACNFHAAMYDLIEKFGTAVTDMFEQIERGQWKDELGHKACMNAKMMALIAPVNDAIAIREAIAAAES